MGEAIGSLFSGIGGLELGLESCGLGPVVWQADSDAHARAVLATHWPAVHRYNDVREINETAPRPDIICGGFPCQDISLAGKGAGIDGERSGLWSEFARIIRALRPAVVFVENVAALANRGLNRVLGDLATLGFDAEWDVFRASDVGAPHRRERLFLLAYSDRERVRQLAERGSWGGAGARETEREHAESVDDRATVADSDGPGCKRTDQRESEHAVAPGRRFMADADSERRDENVRGQDGEHSRWCVADIGHRFPPGPAAIAGWNGPQPAIRRGDDGVPGRSHRLRLLGNSVVSQQAALAWRTLTGRISSIGAGEAA